MEKIKVEKKSKNKKDKKSSKEKKLETKAVKETKINIISDTFASPTNGAHILFDKTSKSGGMDQVDSKLQEKWMDCYVPFE